MASPHSETKIPYKAADYGLNPDESEVDEALIANSEGDLLLLGHLFASVELEKMWRDREISEAQYNRFRGDLDLHIFGRERQLRLADSPRP